MVSVHASHRQLNLNYFRSINPEVFPYSHAHDLYELNILTQGVCRYRLADDTSIELSPGWIAIFPPDAVHGLISVESAIMYGFYLDRATIHALLQDDALSSSHYTFYGQESDKGTLKFPIKHGNHEEETEQILLCCDAATRIPTRHLYDWGMYQSLRILFDKVYAAYNDPSILSAVRLNYIDHLMLVLMVQVLLAPTPLRPASNTEQRILNVKSWIDDHYLETIGISALAEMASLSTEYFTNLFTNLIGVSPKKYLDGCRLRHAGLLVRRSSASIETIATNCGYSNAAYFCRAFKKFYHQSPRRYREDN